MLTFEPGHSTVPPKDAATVVLLRDRSDQPDGARSLEVFLVRRHTKSGFMGGAYVFPGGKLDEADCASSWFDHLGTGDARRAAESLDEEESARALGLFVAACRETFEEAGVLLADMPSRANLMESRSRLADGQPFLDVVRGLHARLRLDQLVAWSRWITPAAETRRYDTRFFLARAPGEQEALHDEHETTAGAWMTPQEALGRDRAGEIQLPPPTLRSLEILSDYSNVDAALIAAQDRTPPLIEPVFHDRDGTRFLALPGDPEHPVEQAVIPGPTRFVFSAGRWWSGEPPAG